MQFISDFDQAINYCKSQRNKIFLDTVVLEKLFKNFRNQG